MSIHILTLPVLMCFEANKTRPTHQKTDANLYLLERQLTKATDPSNLTTSEDSLSMIS